MKQVETKISDIKIGRRHRKVLGEVTGRGVDRRDWSRAPTTKNEGLMIPSTLTVQDVYSIGFAACRGAAQVVVGAIHHKIAVDVQIERAVNDESEDYWALMTDPPLYEYSPEVAAAMNSAASFRACLLLKIAKREIELKDVAGQIEASVTYREVTIRKHAKILAEHAIEQLNEIRFIPITQLPSWSELCTPGYVNNHTVLNSRSDIREFSVARKPKRSEKQENLAHLYEKVLRILSEHAKFFAWAVEILLCRQALSAQEVREYLGWQTPQFSPQKTIQFEANGDQELVDFGEGTLPTDPVS